MLYIKRRRHQLGLRETRSTWNWPGQRDGEERAGKGVCLPEVRYGTCFVDEHGQPQTMSIAGGSDGVGCLLGSRSVEPIQGQLKFELLFIFLFVMLSLAGARRTWTMLGAARLLRLGGANVRSSDSLSRTAIKTMATKVFVLPIDLASQSASGVLPSVNPTELWNSTPTGSKPPKVGTTRIFYNTPSADQGHVNATAIVSLGEGFDKKSGEARRELVRKAVGSGVKQVKELGDEAKDIVIDASQDAHAAGGPYLTVL